MGLTPRSLGPDDPALEDVLALIQAGFAPMEGRIDPPSSAQGLTLAGLRAHLGQGMLWTIGAPPVACALGLPKGEALYLSKITTAPALRGRGYARQLILHAADTARAAGLGCLELQSRVELTDVHAAFRAMGFAECGRTAHPGYDRPTSITFRRDLNAA